MTLKTFAKAALAAATFAATATTASAWGFDICEDVTVIFTNMAEEPVEIYDIDYYDFGQSMWRSEPISNSTILPGEDYVMNRNLEDVEDANTKIRVQVRLLDDNGRFTERYYVESEVFTCRHGQTIEIDGSNWSE